jgi:ABC-2 type transport system permease protein
MRQFYRRYPEWSKVPVPEHTYSNAWYYAMQQRGDDEARPAVDAYHATLARRSEWVDRMSVLFPPALLQRAFSAVARTDVDSHLAYLTSVAEYHERLKQFFYPPIFKESTVAEVRWTDVPQHYFRDDRPVGPLGGQPGLTLATVALLLLGIGAVTMWYAWRWEQWPD